MASIFAENFSIYLKNIYDYPKIISSLQDNASTIFKAINKYNGIDLSFGKNSNDYPKYQNDIQVFNKLHQFDLQKIRESSLDNTEKLLSYIENKYIYLKTRFDKMPDNQNDFNLDLSIQKMFYSDILTVYNQKKYFFNNYNIQEYDNYIYNLIGEKSSHKLEQYDFFQLFYLFFFFCTNLQNFSNVVSQINDYLICNNHFDKGPVLSSFSQYINDVKPTFSNLLSKIIVKNSYSMISPSNTLINIIKEGIIEKIDGFIGSFEQFLNNKYGDPIFTINKLFNDVLIHSLSYELINKIYDDEMIISQILPSNKFSFYSEKEEILMRKYTSIYDQYNVRQYLYVLFLYKFYPFKFLNLIPIISKEYVESQILTVNDLFITENQTQTALYEFYSKKINFDNLSAYLLENLNTLNIYKNIVTQKLNVFTINTFYCSVIEKYIASNYFHKYAEELLYHIYDKLYNEGYIERKFNYRTGFKSIKFFISTFLKHSILNFINGENEIYDYIQSTYSNKWLIDHQLGCEEIEFFVYDQQGNELKYSQFNILNNNQLEILFTYDAYKGSVKVYKKYKLFDNLSQILLNDINQCLFGNIEFIEKEKLSGRLDNFNCTFSTTYPFDNDQDGFILYKNDIEIDSSNYTKFGNYRNIVLNDPPLITDTITCTYKPTYSINFNITSKQVNKYLTNFYNSKSVIFNSHKFIKNMLLSSVTKDIIYRIMMYYLI